MHTYRLSTMIDIREFPARLRRGLQQDLISPRLSLKSSRSLVKGTGSGVKMFCFVASGSSSLSIEAYTSLCSGVLGFGVYRCLGFDFGLVV